jgi:tubulin polyglutamylase complex subunit 2
MDRREAFNKATLSCITYLESFPECRNVNFQCGDGAASHESLVWDKKNAPYKLPKDLKNFYSMFNGVHLSWNVELGDRVIQVGEVRVNRMEAVKPVDVEGSFSPGLWSDSSSSVPDKSSSAAFILDSHCEVGDVVLLYRTKQISSKLKEEESEVSRTDSVESPCCYEEPEVWFVDQSSRWHYLCKTFTQYLRLLVIHLGVHGWQLAFTSEGLPSTTEHWMTMFCKERLIIDRYWRERLLRN